MRIKNLRCLLLFLCISFTSTSYAWHPVFSFGGGTASTSHAGQFESFSFLDAIPNYFSYYPRHVTQTSGIVDVFAGAEWALPSGWLLQAGVDYNQTAPFTVQGTLVQQNDFLFAPTDPDDNIYFYRYRSQVKQVLLEGKLLGTIKQFLHPYFMAGVGPSFNSAYNFHSNVDLDTSFTRTYLNNTETSFSYALGVGIDADISPQMRVGLGYRFANMGKLSLGNADIIDEFVYGTLSQSDLYVNQLLFQFTWLVL